MDHTQLEQSHAAERYLLNEMSGEEREGFEEHFFDCPVCAADVADGERMLAAGRKVARETATVIPFRRGWTAWLPAAAAAMLLVANVVLLLPRRTAPTFDVLRPQMIGAGESRAANAPAIEFRAGENGLLYVDVPPDPPFPRYELQLRDSTGKVVLTRPVTAEQAKESLTLLLGSLPAGSYVLAIEGVREEGNRTEIAKHEITVR
jgi:hypothetical protein